MLFCASLDKLIVSLTTVSGSHECPNYYTVHFCVKTAKLFLEKMKYYNFCQMGQVLSPSQGQVLALTLFMIPCHITYKQPSQMITELNGDQVRPDRYRSDVP